jgi:hypothetical protein
MYPTKGSNNQNMAESGITSLRNAKEQRVHKRNNVCSQKHCKKRKWRAKGIIWKICDFRTGFMWTYLLKIAIFIPIWLRPGLMYTGPNLYAKGKGIP